MAYPLDPQKTGSTAEPGTDNDAVKTALLVIADFFEQKEEQDGKNEAMIKLHKDAYAYRDGSGSRKIGAKKLVQSMLKYLIRTKPLDSAVHGVGRPEYMEMLVEKACSTVMNMGGFESAFREKRGIFTRIAYFGDGFLMVGTNPEEGGAPFIYSVVENSNVYVNNSATGIRHQGWGRNATKAVVIFSYSFSEASKMFEKIKAQNIKGRIPRDYQLGKETTQKFNQDQDKSHEELVEVAYFYDIENQNYTVFAGSSCTVIKEVKKYPFIMEGKPYIPLFQFIGLPSLEGFFSHSIASAIQDLCVAGRQLTNLSLGHIQENAFPLTIINAAEGEAAKFFQKQKIAYQKRAKGEPAHIVMEYDPNNPDSGRVTAESLYTESPIGEWQIMEESIDRNIKRFGIPLDEVDREGDPTATQILSDDENANSLVKQIMEWNASEFEFLYELTLQMIRDFIEPSDKTPVRIGTKIYDDEGNEIPVDEITLGMISEELRTHTYFVKVDSRSGSVPSALLRKSQLESMLALAQPGSKASVSIARQLSEISNVDLKGEDYFAPPETAGGVPGGGGALEAPAPTPTSTDRLTINPRASRQTAVI